MILMTIAKEILIAFFTFLFLFVFEFVVCVFKAGFDILKGKIKNEHRR